VNVRDGSTSTAAANSSALAALSPPESASRGLPHRDRRGHAVTAARQRKLSSCAPGLHVPHHCPEAEYADLISRQPLSAEWRKKHLNRHLRFVRAYPDLAAWPASRCGSGWAGAARKARAGVSAPAASSTRLRAGCACPRKARASATST